MGNCSKHPLTVPGYEDLESLAQAVENLRYDALSQFLSHLGRAIWHRALADQDAGKQQLARELSRADNHITDAQLDIDKAWKICKPYMDEDNSRD